jgi:hypothetical protein
MPALETYGRNIKEYLLTNAIVFVALQLSNAIVFILL